MSLSMFGFCGFLRPGLKPKAEPFAKKGFVCVGFFFSGVSGMMWMIG